MLIDADDGATSLERMAYEPVAIEMRSIPYADEVDEAAPILPRAEEEREKRPRWITVLNMVWVITILGGTYCQGSSVSTTVFTLARLVSGSSFEKEMTIVHYLVLLVVALVFMCFYWWAEADKAERLRHYGVGWTIGFTVVGSLLSILENAMRAKDVSLEIVKAVATGCERIATVSVLTKSGIAEYDGYSVQLEEQHLKPLRTSGKRNGRKSLKHSLDHVKDCDNVMKQLIL